MKPSLGTVVVMFRTFSPVNRPSATSCTAVAEEKALRPSEIARADRLLQAIPASVPAKAAAPVRMPAQATRVAGYITAATQIVSTASEDTRFAISDQGASRTREKSPRMNSRPISGMGLSA